MKYLFILLVTIIFSCSPKVEDKGRYGILHVETNLYPLLKVTDSTEFNIDKALQKMEEENKPGFIFFTRHDCIGSRKFLSVLVEDSGFINSIKKNFVYCELYVDDKGTKIPEKKLVVSTDTIIANTMGHFNLIYEINLVNKNSQPYFVIIDQDENVLGKFDYSTLGDRNKVIKNALETFNSNK